MRLPRTHYYDEPPENGDMECDGCLEYFPEYPRFTDKWVYDKECDRHFHDRDCYENWLETLAEKREVS